MQLPDGGAPVERSLIGDRCLPAEVSQAGCEVIGAPQDLYGAVNGPVGQRAPHDAGRLVDPVLAPQEVSTLIDEEDAPVRRQETLQEAPERLEATRRDVGQEEA